jgi:hypothetical protein
MASWDSEITLSVNTKFWIGYDGAFSNVVLGRTFDATNVPVAAVGTINNSPCLMSSTRWLPATGPVSPLTIPTTGTGTGTAVIWYRLV